jgi:predicted small metal-binding protein
MAPTRLILREQDGMGEVLRCEDLVNGCAFEARETEEEILHKAAPHAKEAHGMDVTPDLVATVKGAIREEPARA